MKRVSKIAKRHDGGRPDPKPEIDPDGA
jgi:hypothetical protein